MRVTGYLDGAMYDVHTDAGGVRGSTRVETLLRQWAGRRVLCSPTGPSVTVNPADERSVLALLEAETRVVSVDDGPDLLGPRRYRAVP